MYLAAESVIAFLTRVHQEKTQISAGESESQILRVIRVYIGQNLSLAFFLSFIFFFFFFFFCTFILLNNNRSQVMVFLCLKTRLKEIYLLIDRY